MNVLFTVWELDPFIKFGGLGDVARSLPFALKKRGVDIRSALPYYSAVRLGRNKKTKVAKFRVEFAKRNEMVEVYKVFHPLGKNAVYLVRNKRYLEIPKSQDAFAFFDKAIVEAIKNNHLGFVPEIIHCNDHHTGLIPLLVKENKLRVKTILTIHNLAYQGSNPVDIVKKLGLDESKCRVLHWEIKSRKINFLMEGIIHADIVTTVSPTYAKEIKTEEFGAGLEEILRGKEGRIFGILNGIDLDYRLFMHRKVIKIRRRDSSEKYKKHLTDEDLGQWEHDKSLNKLFLQRKLGLIENKNIPLLSFIGRFDPRQKGIDILHKMLRRIDVRKFEFIFLGSGNHDWEERFQWLCKFYPKNVSCNFRFDEVLAHQIYAASDFILIPSKFEPCGLIQMMAMFCGTLPIAHKTGGLSDSIKHLVNGFLFEKYSSEALEKTMNEAVEIWRRERTKYRMMVQNAFATDFSWEKSAGEYLNLYTKLYNNTF